MYIKQNMYRFDFSYSKLRHLSSNLLQWTKIGFKVRNIDFKFQKKGNPLILKMNSKFNLFKVPWNKDKVNWSMIQLEL